jgi:hypothetical protein
MPMPIYQWHVPIYGAMQAAAKRAGPGEGGLAKLREAIEAFARKQPEQFVQVTYPEPYP